MNWIELDVITFQYFIIVFARLSSMTALSPVLGSGSVPITTKVGFSFLLSLVIFPVVSRNFPMLPDDSVMFWLMIGREVLVGMLIGVIGNLMFSAVQLSGQIFGMQVGFGIVNVIDPMSDEQISLLGQFEFLVAILLFFAINGHHVLIRVIADSYNILPMNAFVFSEPLLTQMIGWLDKSFMIAFRIGMPVIFVLLMVSVGLGIIARTVPQMNVFIVGIPIQIFIGLMTLGASMGLITYLLRGYFDTMFKDIFTVLRIAGGG